MILKVGRVTTLGLDDGLKRCGPSPPGLKHRPPDRGPADLDQFEAPLGKLPHLIRPLQERLWDRQAEGLSGLEVDDQLEVRRSLDGEIGGFAPFRILST